MAEKIPRYQAENKLPRYGGAAELSGGDIQNLSAAAGQQSQTGWAVAGLSSRMFGMALRRKEEYNLLKENAYVSDVRNRLSLENDRIIRSFAEDPDYETMLDRYTTQITAFHNAELSNVTDKNLNEKLRSVLTDDLTFHQSAVSKIAEAKRRDLFENNLLSSFNMNLQDGNFDTAYEQVTDAFEDGIINNARYQSMLSDYATAFAASLGYEDGKKWLYAKEGKGQFANLPELDAGHREIAAHNTDFIEAQRTQQDAVAMEQMNQLFWQELRSGNLLELQKKIDASPLPVTGTGGKKWWTDLIKQHLTGGDHDPAVYWPLLRKMTTAPDSVSEADIAQAVGKGINTNDYKELMGIKEKKADPLKSTRANLYFDTFNALYGIRKGEKPTKERLLDVDNRSQKMKEFFSEPRNAKESAEFFDELTADLRTNRIWQMFKRLSEAHLAVVSSEYRPPKTVEEFKNTIWNIEDDDEARKYYERWKDNF
jgi:hypothetical protein